MPKTRYTRIALGLLVVLAGLVSFTGCNVDNTMSPEDIKRMETKPPPGGPPPEALKMIQKLNEEARQKMLNQTQQQAAPTHP
ncbi:hypothetical protein CWRG_00771 [Chthonomonas calidirosea]|uniref:Prokaryotic membrane lipoprotein lipid attachment site n=1 Tax=Chthonomonas calidirosea (strain DSM 23976 / ICMP 18418 / T49) TaxID=1303518 RepID=S0ESJ5_CHTCT|nr:hypothetical protein [Chthonomonas calidirosea]CCW34214.1 hypothetical protein CCALI_00377 [Chthonomonas calidirosea T49]CEK14258.1 hypothetical protein CP488_00780 [Chthonomonas calidirosea]CEK14259.1 hypothetical protein CWRG_00771 [Chthonomonas calidirosea]CEK15432.1 hypothetical protein CTKA_00780 [Chthonomonas calidirosea]